MGDSIVPTVTPTYPADDTGADVSDYNLIIQSILAVFNGNIDADNLATSAITTPKMANDAVTAAKIASDAVTTAKILDANVTTAKLADASVTNAKLATGSDEPGGAWNSWTTTLSNGALGNGTIVSTYKQVGKTVFFKLLWTLGSTSSISGFVSFTLPVTAASTAMDNANSIIGTVSMRDDSASALNIGAVRYTSTTSASILRNTGDTYAAISATTPFTWATSDVLWCQGLYEAA